MGQDHLHTAATRNVPVSVHIPVSLQRITTAVPSNFKKLASALGSRPLRFNKDAHHCFLAAHAIAYRRLDHKDSTPTKKIPSIGSP